MFFFFVKAKRDSNIKGFIESQLPVKSNEVDRLVTVRGRIFLLIYAALDFSDLTITRRASLVKLIENLWVNY